MTEKIQPPVAKIIPTILEKFGDIRIDNFFWLKDRENRVIDYLNKENEYYQNDCTYAGISELFEEMKARIEDDQSLFIQWLLLYNFEKGLSYLFSKERELSAKEEIMFDCNRKGKNTSI
jgi:oligopeptidase B